LPFIEIENNNTKTTGIINIYSSSQEGTIVSLDIRRDYSSGYYESGIQDRRPEKFGIVRQSSSMKYDVLKEWNSIFAINDRCNAGSTFISGENRDKEFIYNLNQYVSETWYGELEEYLWGDVIGTSGAGLSTTDPEQLKNIILYQFNYFGASDDIRALGVRSYPNYAISYLDCTVMRWHFGLGAITPYQNAETRRLAKELTYMAPLEQYKEIYKVVGLPPMTAYSHIIENNINIAKFLGNGS
jgi:hypothetical protein